MVRRLVHALVIVMTLVVGATAAAVIVSQTAWFKDWLRGYIERQAMQYLNGQFTIQRLGGNIFFGVELENIGVSMDGSEVVAVKDIGLDYNLFQLIARGLSVDNIRLNQPVLYLRRDGDAWSISRLIKRERSEADRQGPARPITIDDIGIIDGSVVIEGPVGTSGVVVPARFDRLDAKLSVQYEPVRYSIDFDNVSFRASDPSIALNALSGGVSVHDDSLFMDKLAVQTAESSLLFQGAIENYLTTPVYKVEVTSDKFSLSEWAGLVPALSGTSLQSAFELKTNGRLDQLGIDLNVRSDAGQLRGTVVADLMKPGHSVNGTLSVHTLDLAPIVNKPEYRSDITGDATVNARLASFSDLDSLQGHLDLNAPKFAAAGYAAEQVQAKADFNGRNVRMDGKAIAYGASATAAGRVTLPDEKRRVAFDVRGQTRNLDLRRLPRNLKVAAAQTNIAIDYHAIGSAPVGGGVVNARVDARFHPSTIAGTRVASGSTAKVSLGAGRVGYAVDAEVADLDLQRIGTQFKIPALARSRYASSLNGHVVASGEGTRPRQMTLQATGTLHESSIIGGRIPQLAFDAKVGGDSATINARGSFAEFDPAVVSGKAAMKGSVGGTLDVNTTLENMARGVTPDSVRATGIVNLESSTVGGLQMTRATVDGDYENSTGVIRTLHVAGRDLNVQARGTLALNETGQSNLTVHADSTSLDEIGKLVGRPLGGIASVDATVTGNRRELVASGKLTGGGVRYGNTNALSLTSDFTAAVPELDVAAARLKAISHGTFVSIAGQEINELTATTEYNNKQLTFDASAKQPQRSLDAGGRVMLHPDHQEIHLQRLTLQSQGIAWTTAPGSEPAIQYARDTVAVRSLRLVNGDQQIAADGSFGRPGDALKVTLDNIDLATVDALLLQPPRYSGRLTATGTVSGSRSAPAVDADFNVVAGGFREFHYDRLGGSVTYTGKGIQLDARMDHEPATWLTAKGYAPMSLFKPRPAAAAVSTDHAAPAAADDRVDLRIDSSPIDLGIVQGFAPGLSNVTGAVEAHVHVTGTGEDPHPTGSVAVDKGAFTVDNTGVSYSNLRGEVALLSDRIHIDNLYVLDNHDSFLSLTGDLGIHERQVGDVRLFVTSRDFKVIDNNLGNVRLNTDLEVTGELRAPQIDGDLSVSTGQINLDEIVAMTSDSAYSTKPTEYLEAPPATDAEPAAGSLPRLDSVRMNVGVSIPDDLIVKAVSLETPGSPVGAGTFTITLGGDLRVTREPGSRPRLLGSLNTVRGFYDFQGRRFAILRDGTIRFDGLDEFDPVLDLRAQRVIRAVTANVNVRGSLKYPEIVLWSTPPLEQADIMALVVFNQPVNELGEGQQISLAQRAQSLAAGALQTSINRALNIDEFAINLAPESGDVAALTIGQQIGQNLWVKVEQGLGNHGQTNFVLEYELTDWLRLHTNVLQGSTTQQQLFQRMQGSGADLLFFFSY